MIRYQFTLNAWLHHCQDKRLHPYWSQKKELTTEGRCVFWKTQVIVPSKQHTQLIEELHEAHQGISRIKALAHVWWPNMDRELETAVKPIGKQCQLHQKASVEAPLHPKKVRNAMNVLLSIRNTVLVKAFSWI